jgi:hypothetical protein
VDQPSPADEASNADVGGYFLTPFVRSFIELTWAAFLNLPVAVARISRDIADCAQTERIDSG